MDKVKKTKVFIQEYKGNTTFSVWAVDENGDQTGKFPEVSLGKAKGNALMKHLDEFKQYLGVSKESGGKDLLEGL